MAAAAHALENAPRRKGAGSADGSAFNETPPAWFKKILDLNYGRYTITPNLLYDKVYKACTGVEALVVGLILRNTAGARDEGYPEWLQIPEAQFARTLDVHRNSVANAVAALEEMGAIEVDRKSKTKRYRCAFENWKQLKPRESVLTEVAQDDDATEEGPDEETCEASAAPIGPVIKMPGWKRPRPLSAILERAKVCKGCTTRIEAEIARPDEDVPAESPAPAAAAPPTLSTPAIERPTPIATPSDTPTKIAAWLKLQFAGKIAQPPSAALIADVARQLDASGTPLEWLFQRVIERGRAYKSHGLLKALVEDAIAAYTVHAEDAGPAEPELSPAEAIRAHAAARIAEVEAHAPKVLSRARVIETLEEVNANAALLATQPDRLRKLLAEAQVRLGQIVWDDLTKDERKRVEAVPDEGKRFVWLLAARRLRVLTLEAAS